MSPTDLSETSLEIQIVADLTGLDPAVIRAGASGKVAERGLVSYDADWVIGQSTDYDRSLGIDTAQLFAFLQATQPEVVADLGIGAPGNARQGFLQRLSTAILGDGVLTVLRKGLGHHQHTVRLYFPLPTPGNEGAAARFRQNRFSVTRQLRYSTEETKRASFATVPKRRNARSTSCFSSTACRSSPSSSRTRSPARPPPTRCSST